MHATVHLADLGVAATRRWRSAAPRANNTPGLLWSKVVTPAPLGPGPPRPQFGRHGLIALWDNDDAANRFLAHSDLLTSGWHVRLEAVRAIGSWPGVPQDLPTSPVVTHDGPTVVITLGRLRLTQALRFFRASWKAEEQVMASPGLTWATGLAAPPRQVATLSWWHDASAMGETVRGDGSHLSAISQQRDKDFHHESAFVRFRLVSVRGALQGRNPFADLSKNA